MCGREACSKIDWKITSGVVGTFTLPMCFTCAWWFLTSFTYIFTMVEVTCHRCNPFDVLVELRIWYIRMATHTLIYHCFSQEIPSDVFGFQISSIKLVLTFSVLANIKRSGTQSPWYNMQEKSERLLDAHSCSLW